MNHEFSDVRLCLAPIKGFTDHVYRDCFAAYFPGFDYAIAPFISTIRGRKVNAKLVRGVLPENNRKLKCIPQLLSNDPDDLLFFAKHLYDLGLDEVNWNLGCPHQKITRKKRGSGLLPHPHEIDRILEKVVPKLPGKLSVKTRLGRENTSEIFRLLEVFNKYPLTELIIHARTGVQIYEGAVHPGVFEKCLPLSRNSLSYNGDINRPEDFHAFAARFPGVKRWMLGRGAMADPFLPGMIKGDYPEEDERRRRLTGFHGELLERYLETLRGPHNVLGRMKAIWYYMSVSFQGGRALYDEISKMEDLDAYRERMDAFFSGNIRPVLRETPPSLTTEFLKRGD